MTTRGRPQSHVHITTEMRKLFGVVERANISAEKARERERAAVQRRAEAVIELNRLGVPYRQIAEEIGWDVKNLIAAVTRYRKEQRD